MVSQKVPIVILQERTARLGHAHVHGRRWWQVSWRTYLGILWNIRAVAVYLERYLAELEQEDYEDWHTGTRWAFVSRWRYHVADILGLETWDEP